MSQQREQEDAIPNEKKKKDQEEEPLNSKRMILKQHFQEQEEHDPMEEFCNEMCLEIQKSRKCPLLYRTFGSFLLFLILAIFFIIKNETGDTCSWLGFFSLLFWIFCLIFVFIRIPIDLILILLPWKSGSINFIIGFHRALHSIEVTFYIVYMIIATLLYLILREECETLGPLVKWFLIISYIVLIIWAIIDYNEKKKWEEENL